jgi:CRISPR-associated endonuclease Cas2
MAKRKKREWSFVEKMRLLKKAGLRRRPPADGRPPFDEEAPLPPPAERVDLILRLLALAHRKKHDDMFCFIMYDITDDRIRLYLAKYLLRMGCQRIQKSVYIARFQREEYDEVCLTLKEVNDMYDNEDSVFIVPIGESYLRELKMVGKNVDFSIVVDTPGTLFI